MKQILLFAILAASALAQPTLPGNVPFGAATYPSIGETPVVGQCAKWISSTRLGSVVCGSGSGGGVPINWINSGWSADTTYQPNDAVKWNGNSYVAIATHTNSQPPSGFWFTLAEGGAVGPAGPAGATGPAGPQGLPGLPGSQIYAFSSICPPGLGNVGDFCLDTTNGNYYFKTGAAMWTPSGSLRGPTGPAGASSSPGGSDGQIQFNNAGVFGGRSLNSTGSGTSAIEIPNMQGLQAAIDAKTVPVMPGTDNNKTMVVDDTGAAILKFISRLDAFVFDSGASGTAITASCTADKLESAATLKRLDLVSISRTTMADIVGSATVTIYTSPATGSTTWTTLATASLTGGSRAKVTATGTIAADSWVAACITGTPSTIEKLIVSPVVY